MQEGIFVNGIVETVNTYKTKKGAEYKGLQMKITTGNRIAILDLKDYSNGDYKLGPAKIKVLIRAYNTETGGAGVSYVIVGRGEDSDKGKGVL